RNGGADWPSRRSYHRDRSTAGMETDRLSRGVAVSGIALFSRLARCQGALQTDGARCIVGAFAARLDDGRVQPDIRSLRKFTDRRCSVPAVRFFRVAAVDILFQ